MVRVLEKLPEVNVVILERGANPARGAVNPSRGRGTTHLMIQDQNEDLEAFARRVVDKVFKVQLSGLPLGPVVYCLGTPENSARRDALLLALARRVERGTVLIEVPDALPEEERAHIFEAIGSMTRVSSSLVVRAVFLEGPTVRSPWFSNRGRARSVARGVRWEEKPFN